MKKSLAKQLDNILLREDSKNGITKLTLNRPKKYNTLSLELLNVLQNHLDSISGNRSIRVIIIKGSGTAFCAGHDLSEMIENPEESEIRRLFENCSKMMISLTRLPQPVIAQVHGIATAAGCQLVAQCDLAVASYEASFATSGIGVGLYCGTPSVAVTRNLPRKQAMELLLTGEFIDAQQALNYGLINKISSPESLEQTVNELAVKIAGKGPEFIARGKHLFYSQLDSGLKTAYEEATTFMVEHFKLKSTQAGLNAFLNKQPMPDWSKIDE